MRGRFQAIAVAFAGSLLLPYISLAVVGLITLRKGVQEGFLVLLCSLIAPLVLVQPGLPLAALVVLFIAALVVAGVLRASRLLAGGPAVDSYLLYCVVASGFVHHKRWRVKLAGDATAGAVWLY